MSTIRSLATVAGIGLLLSTTAPAPAADEGVDWSRWRGPDLTGTSPETGWSATGHPEPLWTKKVGYGHSSFVIADGRLYTMGHDVDRGLDLIHCLEPETGEEIWTHACPAEFWNEGHDGGTCTTPIVDGETVYASNREGKLFALNAATGAVRWQHDMRSELGVEPPRWGFAGSPVIVDDMAVVNVDKMAAFDKTTGELQWITERGYGNAYSTPIHYDFNGRPAMLVLNGLGLAVIDRKDGSEITFHSWARNPERSVYGMTPMILGERIFISAASGGGAVMLEPNEDDGLDVVWESRVMRASYAGCVLVDDHLYGFDASILKCIDLDGNEKWRERGIGVGALSAAGGRLVIIGAKGELIIAEANPERYVELSREKVLDGGACWSTPVLSHGLIYARNSLGDVVCRDHRSTGDTLATGTSDTPAPLPDAAALLARHVEAIGGADALRGLDGVHLTGQGESHGGPIERCDAELMWTASGAFIWRFSSGLDMGYNPELGWSMTQTGPAVLESDRIEELREIGDLHRMLAPSWGYTSLQTVGTRVFDDRRCYVVEAELESGAPRTLYFEVASGLMAGREGADLPLWTFDEYASVGSVLVPMEWSTFSSESGSMTMARFAAGAAGAVDSSLLDPPTLIRMMTRSDEEKERENARLRAEHGHLVGAYKLASGSMAGALVTFSIDDGALRMAFGPQPPDYLSEPDADRRLYVLSNRQLWFEVTPSDDGGDPVIVLWAYGDEFGRLERVKDD